ncbi:hypothetical protein HK099_004092 [Clydaea vesicula]|uniref:Major facilitator superfamily (MFS) profile domain-containing protein n=1 Tax=Clydaea vesicula TaxID=447962 RepID=A0AAD5U0X5_9FUNG|nr:hypothetical protein HK099_004092 [Clydaea vesicula]
MKNNLLQQTGKRITRSKATDSSPKEKVPKEEDTPLIRTRLAEARRSGFLDLRNLNLSQIPQEVLKLSEITTLLLGSNKLSSLPQQFAVLFPNLAFLDLSSNKITSVPKDLFDLENLEIVDIEGNNEAIKKLSNPSFDAIKEKIAIFTGKGVNFEDDFSEVRGSNSASESEGSEDEDDEEAEEEEDATFDDIARDKFFLRLDAMDEYSVSASLKDRFESGRDPVLLKYVLKRYSPTRKDEKTSVSGIRDRQKVKAAVKQTRELDDKFLTKDTDRRRKDKAARVSDAFGNDAKQLIDGLVTSLFPYMVKLLIKQEHDVGYYTGLLGSAFYAPLLIMNTFWGGLSDYTGRKPILLIGLVFCGISSLLLGFSETYWVTFTARFIAGIFGANSTVCKGRLGEISDEVQKSFGYQIYGAMHGVCQILGPAIGGMLFELTKHFQENNPFFIVLIPGYISVFISLITTVLFLEEPKNEYNVKNLLKKYQRNKFERKNYEILNEFVEKNMEQVEDGEGYELNDLHSKKFVVRADEGNGDLRENSVTDNTVRLSNASEGEEAFDVDEVDDDLNSDLRNVNSTSNKLSFIKSFWNHSAFIPILLYCIIAIVNMMYNVALPLFFSTSVSGGGIGLSPSQSALPFTFAAIFKLTLQLSPFYKILAKYGSKTCYVSGMMLLSVVLCFLPVVGILVIDKTPWTKSVMLAFVMTFVGMAEAASYQSVILMISKSVPYNKLGVTQGFASSCSALMRTFAPASAGVLWEVGMKLNFTSFVFGNCLFVALIGIIVALYSKDPQNFEDYAKS